ncbi:MAG: DNA primase [Polaromonas sp.]|nr:DNA primase [Gemmatimonadaceae bacterium]
MERVRESADIVGVIGEYVQLKRTGADFRGPCPFHQGTGRNFSVSPKIGRYHCFVCHESGDVFSYLMKRIGVDFVTAVKMVGEKSGIEVIDIPTGRPDEKDAREPLWEVNAAAAEYFSRTLWNEDSGTAARAYIAQRDVSRELADKVGLGYAPREIGLMRGHLNTLGFDDERLIEAGLLHVPEGVTEPRPRFRDRLIFPIYDVSSRVVGFGGRLLGPGEPKYLNSAESPVFSKGKLLYGLNWAKQAARRDERMLVVEGYFDVMRLIGAGVESVVAPMGTALTDEQAKLVRRYTQRVYLLYDSDKAGLKATFRSGDELLAQGASVQVVTLPDGEDPDTFVRTHGARGLETQLASSIDVFERKIQLLERGGWFADLRKKRQALDRLLPTLRATIDPITRALYTSHLERISGITGEVLEAEVRAVTKKHTRSAPFVPQAIREASIRESDTNRRPGRSSNRTTPGSSGRPTEREFVRVLLHRPWLIEKVSERLGPTDILNPLLRNIFRSLINVGSDMGQLVAELDEDSIGILQELHAESAGLDSAETTIQGVFKQINELQVREELEELKNLSVLASADEKTALLQQIVELSALRRAGGGKGWNVGRRSAHAEDEKNTT